MSAVDNYRAALRRLIEGKPKSVPKGSAINKDTVALEAGRKRGSIKKSRAEHAELIAEIEAAAAAVQQESSRLSASEDAKKQRALKQAAKDQLNVFKAEYELALQEIATLAQENYSLQHENDSLKQKISEITAEKQHSNVVPLGNLH
ncbi:hypothetical protein [Geopseudomonas guangdongensis]|uniref:Uncharacterized protein n=1 Tax=Geopseudomonas guangdongensis TaxID=1245526 RepID=A0A1H2EM13_9GAMM|nr:hypothetical protein [Pseudomonas guangdongensis]SDT96131.1 hypothetical protein SAMN05216580_0702 [Pseudomonas guangdongensis]